VTSEDGSAAACAKRDVRPSVFTRVAIQEPKMPSVTLAADDLILTAVYVDVPPWRRAVLFESGEHPGAIVQLPINNALHIIAITRARRDPLTKE
jgi:hypothetical protein